jgi:hypothetical protein
MHRCLPLTYAPKVESVFSGVCRQSIRRGERFSVGDKITFFTWAGKPYRSKWDRRYEARLTAAYPIKIIDARPTQNIVSILSDRVGDFPAILDDGDCASLARQDGIMPNTRAGLVAVLDALHGGKSLSGKWQVLRW